MEKSHHSQLPHEFKLIKQIGKGSFSSVWLGKCLVTNKNVAIKIIPKSILKKAEYACSLIKKEVRIHKQLFHENIASFYKILENETHNFIMIEYIKGNNLYNVANSMRKNGFPLIESDIRKYFIQLLSAVNYLHNELHIVHRDLKLDNVMIDVNDDAKLIDFGFSSFIDDHDELKQPRGSPRYAAPEIFLKLESTTSVDMWALGIILYYCFTGYFPFDSDKSTSELASKILFGKLEFTDNMDHNVRSLLRGLLRKNPTKRMTCLEALQHPWIINFNNNCECENNESEQNSFENYKSNSQTIENLQDVQVKENQNFSKKEKISKSKSTDSPYSNVSTPSKESTFSIQNKYSQSPLQNKKIKTSKSTFSPPNLTQPSNHRRTKTKKTINTLPLSTQSKTSKKA